MLATLRHRDFALLWFAGLVSVAGDFALLIALPLHAYALTGSAVATGAVFAASLLPSILLGSVAGVFVDRWDRKRTMVAADLLRAALLLPLLAVGLARSPLAALCRARRHRHGRPLFRSGRERAFAEAGR